eukprot:1368946-Rhodomonas_salina.1
MPVPSPETQQMGHELFSTFTKGNPGAWMAKTSPGIEIEELLDDEIPYLCSSRTQMRTNARRMCWKV